MCISAWGSKPCFFPFLNLEEKNYEQDIISPKSLNHSQHNTYTHLKNKNMGWKNDPENILNLKFKPHDRFLISKVNFNVLVAPILFVRENSHKYEN